MHKHLFIPHWLDAGINKKKVRALLDLSFGGLWTACATNKNK